MAILRWPNEALRQLIEEKDANCFDPRVGNFLMATVATQLFLNC